MKFPKFLKLPSKNVKFSSKSKNFFRHIKIRTRLTAAFLALSLIPLISIGTLAYVRSSSAIETKIGSYSELIMGQLSQNVRIELEKLINNSTEFIMMDTVQKKMNELLDDISPLDTMVAINEVSKTLTNKFGLTKGAESYFIILSNGKTIGTASSSLSLPEFSKAISSKSGDTSSVRWFIDTSSSSSKTIYFCRELKNVTTSRSFGTLVIGLKPEFLTAIYKNLDLGEGSSLFALNSAGIVVSSTDVDEITAPYKDTALLEQIKTKETEGIPSFTGLVNGKPQLVTYGKIGNSDWYMVGTVPETFLQKESRSIRLLIFGAGILCLLFAVLLSSLISKSISDPLYSLIGLMKEAKNGNLSVNIEDRSKDEVGELLVNFNSMVDNMRNLILKVHESTTKVLSNAANIADSAQHSFVASEQISATIQQVAKGASEQAQEVSDGVAHMNLLANNINKVGSEIKDIGSVISDTQFLGEKALRAVNHLNGKAHEASNASDNIMKDISNLENYMKEIKKIVKVIVGIAEQTNLLSLNAAIEAARAGEAGKGFAVVAEEVRKLADQSKDALVNINSIINRIEQQTQLTVKTATIASTTVNEQMEAVLETDQAFKTINGAMDAISSRMISMSQSVQSILSSKDKALETIENISAVSEESAATAEEVSASTQEQIASAEELSNYSKDLNRMAVELENAVKLFTIH